MDKLKKITHVAIDALMKIASMKNCSGPGCFYCKEDLEHLPTLEAHIASEAINKIYKLTEPDDNQSGS